MEHTVVIPLAGMLTGVLTVGAISYAIVKVFRGPVGQALARRLGGKSAEADPELVHELMALREHVDQIEQRLLDAEERIDFGERLLARRSEEPVRAPS
jgi:hypothetical protein